MRVSTMHPRSSALRVAKEREVRRARITSIIAKISPTQWTKKPSYFRQFLLRIVLPISGEEMLHHEKNQKKMN